MATKNLGGRAASLRAASSPALRLVPPRPRPPCAEAVRFCEVLLENARNGLVIGVAVAVAMPGRNYVVDLCGEFVSNLAYARGAVAALDDELSDLVK